LPREVCLTLDRFSDTLLQTMRTCATTFLVILSLLQPSAAQLPRQRRPPGNNLSSIVAPQLRKPQQAEARKLFGLIETSIVNASLTGASSNFAQQVLINMSGGESGYFSANQTVSILQRYLTSRTSLAFSFTRFSDAGPAPYATGRLTSVSRGRRESAQIYVSLRHQDSKWVITQFNIY
jgi:hypothetical protein